MKTVILAAGIGSRLGKPHPKALTVLSNGQSILENQINALLQFVDIDDIYVVVGFKKELIMEAFPELTYIYNNIFDTTNTSKSLLKGLRKNRGNDVLWMNGDVVFDHQVLERLIQYPYSSMAVNTSAVDEEEVKYNVNGQGFISEVSKSVSEALGEAVGINKVITRDLPLLIEKLTVCEDDDYFEKGIESAIQTGMEVSPVDVSDLICKEIDFVEDLEHVNNLLATK